MLAAGCGYFTEQTDSFFSVLREGDLPTFVMVTVIVSVVVETANLRLSQDQDQSIDR